MRNVSDLSWNSTGWLVITFDSTIQERLDLDLGLVKATVLGMELGGAK